MNPLFTCFGSSNLGLPLNPRDAFFYQTTPDFFGFTANPLGFGYRDLGLGTFLRSGFGSAPNPDATLIPFAPSVDGQMQVSTARNVAMTPPGCTTEAPGPFLPEGVLPQWLRQEPEATRPFLQYARRVPVRRDVGKLPDGNDGKGGLLAHARGPEQHGHDGRQSRLDGSGGEPDRRLPANPHGRFHDALSQHQYLYGYVHDRDPWFGECFGVDPGE